MGLRGSRSGRARDGLQTGDVRSGAVSQAGEGRERRATVMDKSCLPVDYFEAAPDYAWLTNEDMIGMHGRDEESTSVCTQRLLWRPSLRKVPLNFLLPFGPRL